MDQQRKRGFAGMDREMQRRIASKGGQASHAKGTAHEFTAEEARAAGRKGGEAVSGNRQHMSEIGRRGGSVSGTRRRAEPEKQPAPERPAPVAMPENEEPERDQSSGIETPDTSVSNSGTSGTPETHSESEVHEEAHSGS